MIQDIVIVTMECNRNSYAIYQMVPFPMTWTNTNPIFKVTSFFDAEYLTNGYRYGHSYYRRRIGNRTQAFKWHHFQWSWVTWPLSQISSHNIIQRQITRKGYKSYNGGLIQSQTRSIEPRRFQWPWTTPNPYFKVRPFFDTEYLRNGWSYGHTVVTMEGE